MFEKEAEERLPQAKIDYYNSFQCKPNEVPAIEIVRFGSGYTKGFKDGAEFGYNKANEWHDLRKDSNNLPKENMKQVMVITNYNECLMGWYCIHQKTWYDCDYPDTDDRIETDGILVIKWKEIVFPKECD